MVRRRRRRWAFLDNGYDSEGEPGGGGGGRQGVDATVTGNATRLWAMDA